MGSGIGRQAPPSQARVIWNWANIQREGDDPSAVQQIAEDKEEQHHENPGIGVEDKLLVDETPHPRIDTSFLSSAICVTPRRQEALYSCIARTPQGDESNIFKYYCPLCMSFFRDILKSTCCGNYICFPCCFEFLHIRGVQISTVNEIFDPALLKDIRCPNCGTLGFTPCLVALQDGVRDYFSNAVSSSKWRDASPIRIGDSFEELKRKMITYKDMERQNRSASSRATSSKDLREGGIAMLSSPVVEDEDGFEEIDIPQLAMQGTEPMSDQEDDDDEDDEERRERVGGDDGGNGRVADNIGGQEGVVENAQNVVMIADAVVDNNDNDNVELTVPVTGHGSDKHNDDKANNDDNINGGGEGGDVDVDVDVDDSYDINSNVYISDDDDELEESALAGLDLANKFDNENDSFHNHDTGSGSDSGGYLDVGGDGKIPPLDQSKNNNDQNSLILEAIREVDTSVDVDVEDADPDAVKSFSMDISRNTDADDDAKDVDVEVDSGDVKYGEHERANRSGNANHINNHAKHNEKDYDEVEVENRRPHGKREDEEVDEDKRHHRGGELDDEIAVFDMSIIDDSMIDNDEDDVNNVDVDVVVEESKGDVFVVIESKSRRGKDDDDGDNDDDDAKGGDDDVMRFELNNSDCSIPIIIPNQLQLQHEDYDGDEDKILSNQINTKDGGEEEEDIEVFDMSNIDDSKENDEEVSVDNKYDMITTTAAAATAAVVKEPLTLLRITSSSSLSSPLSSGRRREMRDSDCHIHVDVDVDVMVVRDVDVDMQEVDSPMLLDHLHSHSPLLLDEDDDLDVMSCFDESKHFDCDSSGNGNRGGGGGIQLFREDSELTMLEGSEGGGEGDGSSDRDDQSTVQLVEVDIQSASSDHRDRVVLAASASGFWVAAETGSLRTPSSSCNSSSSHINEHIDEMHLKSQSMKTIPSGSLRKESNGGGVRGSGSLDPHAQTPTPTQKQSSIRGGGGDGGGDYLFADSKPLSLSKSQSLSERPETKLASSSTAGRHRGISSDWSSAPMDDGLGLGPDLLSEDFCVIEVNNNATPTVKRCASPDQLLADLLQSRHLSRSDSHDTSNALEESGEISHDAIMAIRSLTSHMSAIGDEEKDSSFVRRSISVPKVNTTTSSSTGGGGNNSEEGKYCE
eukprot:gene1223-2377_t